MADCPNLPNCGFIKKFNGSKNLACQGFITMFCRGTRQDQCERKLYRQKNGCPPPDDMMPNGKIMAA